MTVSGRKQKISLARSNGNEQIDEFIDRITFELNQEVEAANRLFSEK